MSARVGLTGCPLVAKVKLPDSPKLLSGTWPGDPGYPDAGTYTRTLKACYAPRRTGGTDWWEYTELDQKLLVVPEPSDPAGLIEVIKGEVWSIPMDLSTVYDAENHFGAVQPNEGDMLILQKYNCENLLQSAVALPYGPSGMITLGAGGLITKQSILEARINELNDGSYRMCMATKESLGDNITDFHPVTSSILLYNEEPHVTLSVPHVVGMGRDIHVEWNLNGRMSHPLDFIALYRKGECKQVDYTENNPYPPGADEATRAAQNQCHLITESLAQDQTEGVVHFDFSTFKVAGEYEARFFRGESRNGQGVVCRGMHGLAYGFESSPTMESCALEARATSNVVTVTAEVASRGGRKSTGGGAVKHIPGLEHAKFASIGL